MMALLINIPASISTLSANTGMVINAPLYKNQKGCLFSETAFRPCYENTCSTLQL